MSKGRNATERPDNKKTAQRVESAEKNCALSATTTSSAGSAGSAGMEARQLEVVERTPKIPHQTSESADDDDSGLHKYHNNQLPATRHP